MSKKYRRSKDIEVEGELITIYELPMSFIEQNQDGMQYIDVVATSDIDTSEMSPYFIEEIGKAIVDFTFPNKNDKTQETSKKK